MLDLLAMVRNQQKIVIGSMAVVIVAWLIAGLFGSRPAVVAIPAFQSRFDADRALEATREFVTRHPRRVLGSLESRQSTAFFRQRLQPLDYELNYTHFNATIDSRTEVGRNVSALRRGARAEMLAVVAHYDTAAPAFQGAMDNGSGIGVLLELGRVFAEEPLQHSLLLVATDGEEWGMLGAADLAQHFPDRDKIAAVLSVDYVAAGGTARLCLEESGLFKGYSPASLRDISRAAAGREGLEVLEPYGLKEHLDRALLLPVTDQGPLVASGIPAINIGSRSQDPALESRIYHSAQDTVENLQASGFKTVGRAAERILRTLDSMPAIPRGTAGPFRATENRYLSATTVTILHALSLVPLFLGALFPWGGNLRRVTLVRLRQEVVALLGIALPLLAVYYVILLLTRTGHIAGYSLYPPGPRDPYLEHPSPLVFATLAIVLLLSAAGAIPAVRYANRKLAPPDYQVSKSVLMVVLTCIVLMGLAYNSYWCVSFFLLAAWSWVMLERPQRNAVRLTNAAVIIVSGLPWYVAAAYYATFLGMGWKIIWFGILALSTGMFFPGAYMLSAGAIAVGARLLALQFMRTTD